MECLDCGQEFENRYYVKKHYHETTCTGEECRFCDRDDFVSRKGKKQHEGREHHRPYKDEDTLRELYIEKGMGICKIAENFDVAGKTIQDWMEKHDIDTRGRLENLRTDTANYVIDRQGYERWRALVDGDYRVVSVHRLLAVSECGFDAVVDNVIHHKNEIPWDNRPENLVVMSDSEHKRLHAKNRWG